MTFREVCEVIAHSGVLKKKDGSQPNGEEIFNYSPTGELYMIWEWYGLAEELFEIWRQEELNQ